MKTEKEVRFQLFDFAKRIGAERDLQNLFDKWDRLIALASPAEREDMARNAILEVQALLDINPVDGLTINNEIVIERKE